MYLNDEHAIRKCFETLERNGLKIATYGENVPSTGSKLSIGECHVNAAWVIKWLMELPAHQGLVLRLKYGTDNETRRDVTLDLSSFVVLEMGRASINKAQAHFILSMWAQPKLIAKEYASGCRPEKKITPADYIDAFDVSPDSATRHIRRVFDLVDRWRREAIAAVHPKLQKLIREDLAMVA